MKQCLCCERVATHKGMCQAHYKRARRGGAMDRPLAPQHGQCSATGCDRPASDGGLCHSHARALGVAGRLMAQFASDGMTGRRHASVSAATCPPTRKASAAVIIYSHGSSKRATRSCRILRPDGYIGRRSRMPCWPWGIEMLTSSRAIRSRCWASHVPRPVWSCVTPPRLARVAAAGLGWPTRMPPTIKRPDMANVGRWGETPGAGPTRWRRSGRDRSS